MSRPERYIESFIRIHDGGIDGGPQVVEVGNPHVFHAGSSRSVEGRSRSWPGSGAVGASAASDSATERKVPGAAPAQGEYQRTKDGKTLVWNDDPKPGDVAAWSGSGAKASPGRRRFLGY